MAPEGKLKCLGVSFFTIDESGIHSEPMIHMILARKDRGNRRSGERTRDQVGMDRPE